MLVPIDERSQMIFVGVDWAEAHHEVHVQDEDGKRLAGRRLPEGVDGIARFHDLIGGGLTSCRRIEVEAFVLQEQLRARAFGSESPGEWCRGCR